MPTVGRGAAATPGELGWAAVKARSGLCSVRPCGEPASCGIQRNASAGHRPGQPQLYCKAHTATRGVDLANDGTLAWNLNFLRFDGPTPRGQATSTDDSASATLQAHATSAGRARRITTRVCTAAGVTDETSATATLLASEIVTNAVVHGNRTPIRFTVAVRTDNVRIEVGDGSKDLPVLHIGGDAEANGGRGMAIVDGYATSWGVRPDHPGKVVWAILARGDHEPDTHR